MKIYRLAWSSKFWFLNASTFADLERLALFGTGRDTATLVPIRVELVQTNNDETLSPSDFPWLASNVPALSERAANRLRNVLVKHGELVELTSHDGEFFALNAKIRADVIDMERSSVTRFRSGAVMEIGHYVFREDAIGDWDIFRSVHDDRSGDIFVSERYVEAVRESGLPGAEFEFLSEVRPQSRSSRDSVR